MDRVALRKNYFGTMNKINQLEEGRRVIRHEGRALEACALALGDSFVAATDLIFACQGRTITCGIGKSGHIARKTAGTLSSTGTPSLFLHAAEAVHGDLGTVTATDVVLLYTQSGETDEIARLFPSLRSVGAKSIVITGRKESTCGRQADVVIDTGVSEEACSNKLAPTTSTTVMLAVSDALAVTVMGMRGFSTEDFARFHPSGTLGKRLTLQVSDVMRPILEIAVVGPEATTLEVIRAMTQAAAGAALVMDGAALVGIVSEGNLRTHLLATGDLSGTAQKMMNNQPLTVDSDLLAADALEVFQNFRVKIGEIPVVSKDEVVGLLTLKDLLRSGIL